jgi:Glycine-zipper domain
MDDRAIGLPACQNVAKMLQRLPIAAANLKSCSFRDPRYFDMSCLRILFFSAATLILLNISVVAQAQNYPPPPNQGYSPPPCQAVTPGPVRGAARGAAGGAMIGAISGNAGRGAAIGAAFGGVRNAVRRGSARSASACY